MTVEDKTSANLSFTDLFSLEREKTEGLLKGIREIAPKRYGTNQYEYYSRTLLGKIKSCKPGEQSYLLLDSLAKILEYDEKGRIDICLDKDGRGRSNLRIGYPSDLTLGVSIDWKNTAKTKVSTGSFSYLPDPLYMSYRFSGPELPDEMVNQIYSNFILGLISEDLNDNRVSWGEELKIRRSQNIQNMEEAVGKDRAWIVERSLEGLKEVAGEEEYMIFAPDIKKKGNSFQPVLYTTATITQELSERFSKAVAETGTYFPTEYRSSNHPDALPLMVTSFYKDLSMEVQGIKKDNIVMQDQELRSSLYRFMIGDKDALTFTIFPPHNYTGIKTALVEINPQLAVF